MQQPSLYQSYCYFLLLILLSLTLFTFLSVHNIVEKVILVVLTVSVAVFIIRLARK